MPPECAGGLHRRAPYSSLPGFMGGGVLCFFPECRAGIFGGAVIRPENGEGREIPCRGPCCILGERMTYTQKKGPKIFLGRRKAEGPHLGGPRCPSVSYYTPK